MHIILVWFFFVCPQQTRLTGMLALACDFCFLLQIGMIYLLDFFVVAVSSPTPPHRCSRYVYARIALVRDSSFCCAQMTETQHGPGAKNVICMHDKFVAVFPAVIGNTKTLPRKVYFFID